MFRERLRDANDDDDDDDDGKVKVNVGREHTSETLRYGTRSQGISQFYLYTPRSSTDR